MSKLLKKRKAKPSKRGIYIHDDILKNSSFLIGEKIEYFMDLNHKTLLINTGENLSEEEKSELRNTVAKKTVKKKKQVNDEEVKEEKVKAVIDLRKKEIISLFEGCKYLQVSIYEDEIVVVGYEDEESEEKENVISKSISKIKNFISSRFKKRANKVISIDNVLKLRKKQTVVFSKKEFSKVVGGEQLSFDFDWDILGLNTSSSVGNIKNALSNIHIPLTIGSWFSCGGVLDQAFKEEGFEIDYAIEKDVDAAQTYRYNHGDHLIVDDVRNINKNNLNKVPVMIGGVPCTAFTKVNAHKKFLEHPDFFLFKEFIAGIKRNENCQVWMIENVEDFIKALDGYCIEEIHQQLPDFEISFGILNSADYGTPMIRRRAILIGSKIGKIDLPEPFLSKENYVPISEALCNVDDLLYNQLDFNKHKPDTLERIKSIPQGGNHWDLPEHLRKGLKAQFSDYLKRLDWNKPSISLPHIRKNLILHPFEDRVLSVREMARIFGLKDDFKFLGKTLDSRQQQIANAVPINLGRAVAGVIKKAIMQFNIRNRKISFA